MEWENIPEDISEFQGFVYLITSPTGKMYVGKKFFWSKKTLPPLKGKKNKRHFKVESDWKDYWGSNAALLEDIKRLGKNMFRREILVLCDSKWGCAYQEAKLQFELEVLLDDNYYNGIINCRLKAMKGKKGDDVKKMYENIGTAPEKPEFDRSNSEELLKMMLEYP